MSTWFNPSIGCKGHNSQVYESSSIFLVLGSSLLLSLSFSNYQKKKSYASSGNWIFISPKRWNELLCALWFLYKLERKRSSSILQLWVGWNHQIRWDSSACWRGSKAVAGEPRASSAFRDVNGTDIFWPYSNSIWFGRVLTRSYPISDIQHP